MNAAWVQSLAPLHSLTLSALAAAIPLVVVLYLMGVARKSGLVAGSAGLAVTAILAVACFALWRANKASQVGPDEVVVHTEVPAPARELEVVGA